MGRILVLLVGAVLIFVLIFIVFRKPSGGGEEEVEDNSSNGVMTIASDVFEAGGLIPAKYTCDGENISPALTFGQIPKSTQSLVLIVDDPDVPKTIRSDGLWIHWLIWNIPADISVIEEGNLPDGIVGKNTSGDKRYGGPCPPDKEHRYFFKLFALDAMLDLDSDSATKTELEKAMGRAHLSRSAINGTVRPPSLKVVK